MAQRLVIHDHQRGQARQSGLCALQDAPGDSHRQTVAWPVRLPPWPGRTPCDGESARLAGRDPGAPSYRVYVDSAVHGTCMSALHVRAGCPVATPTPSSGYALSRMSPVTANPSVRVLPDPTGDLAEFLDDAPVAIHWIDAAGTILWANRAELDLLGYSAEDYVGRPLSAFHVDQDVLADLLDRLTRGETLRDHEVRLRARDGSIRHALISENMTSDGRGGRVSRGFTRDITAQRRAERERTQLIEDLTRTVRLNDMFAGIVGHDLRGPLSTIVMAGQLLLGYVDQPKPVRTIERLLNSADRMQRMISQLLDFARARADGGIELDRRPIDLTDIARDVIEEVRLARPDWKIELVAQGDVRGDYDSNRLSQVFSNLIGNAVQHGSPDTPMTVRIDGRDRDAIRIEVKNRGTIPPEVLPILFSPFRGSQQKALRSQGLGLGLFITDHIVRAHGGTIAAESVDGWTAFRFDLPRHAAGARIATFD